LWITTNKKSGNQNLKKYKSFEVLYLSILSRQYNFFYKKNISSFYEKINCGKYDAIKIVLQKNMFLYLNCETTTITSHFNQNQINKPFQ
jgi:hypothetical protein